VYHSCELYFRVVQMKGLAGIFGLLGLMVLNGSTIQAQSALERSPDENPSPISISTNLVDLLIAVTDRKGNFVDGLQQQNFQVFENGRRQPISIFGRQDLPVAVGLVVDHSASMGPKLREVSAAAEEFARSSNPQDHLFVVNFNEMVSLTLPGAASFTSNEGELRLALAGRGAQGQTALYDAVIDALEHLRLSSLNRQALILVTDGGDNASRHTQKEMFDAARMSNAQIYCIGIYDNDDPDASPRALRRLAKVTGGEAYFPSSPSETTDITRKIATNLREQYLLGFAPEARTEGWQTVRVVASGNEKMSVRSRSGFLFSNPQISSRPAVAPPEEKQ
jgi:Ca-activated chloride channel homolog